MWDRPLQYKISQCYERPINKHTRKGIWDTDGVDFLLRSGNRVFPCAFSPNHSTPPHRRRGAIIGAWDKPSWTGSAEHSLAHSLTRAGGHSSYVCSLSCHICYLWSSPMHSLDLFHPDFAPCHNLRTSWIWNCKLIGQFLCYYCINWHIFSSQFITNRHIFCI